MSQNELRFSPPDDWHLHFRDHETMQDVLPHTARQFRRALAMPNLQPPIQRVEQLEAYRARLLAAIPKDSPFQPYHSLYLSRDTPLEDLQEAAKHPYILGYKYYPAGATTHSAAGIASFRHAYPVFEAMQDSGLVLQIHGESIDPDCDVFEREARFIAEALRAITHDFPRLKIVLEHITTREAVEFVQSQDTRFAATITPQHLLYNRNALFQGGIRPHFYCLPVLKHEDHRRALIEAIQSGDPRFFLGTDSAPHPQSKKENACGCAGIFSAHAAMELYATAFEKADALAHLPAFASERGADFYELPRNRGEVCLEKKKREIPESYDFGGHRLIPLSAGETLEWSFRGQSADA